MLLHYDGVPLPSEVDWMMRSKLLEALRGRVYERLYRYAAKDVLLTDPVPSGSWPVALVSMVRRRDIIAYLVSTKSFIRNALNPHRIVLVCDHDVTDHDMRTLRAHIPSIELVNVLEMQHHALPTGGTWERLYAISQLAKENYVVQLDSDTLTRGPLHEVREAVVKGASFSAGESADQRLVSLSEIALIQAPRVTEASFVQTVAEASFAQLPYPQDRKYVRGCSGFSGFPRSPSLGDALIDFSSRMWAILGDRWTEWGTEQVSSNFLVAGYEESVVLTPPRYGYPHKFDESTEFIHFIGTHRFSSRMYERMSSQFLDQSK